MCGSARCHQPRSSCLTRSATSVAYLDDLQAWVGALKWPQVESAAELEALLPAVLDRAFRGEL